MSRLSDSGSVAPLLGLFLLLHGAMLVYDVSSDQPFYRADRALARQQTVDGFFQAAERGDALTFVASHGNPGDYLLQGVIVEVLGRIPLITLQIVLVLIAGYAVYRVSLRVGLAPAHARWASAVFLLLPHSLVFPHQLSTEAIHSPLIIISIWALVDSNIVTRGRLTTSAVLCGVASLVRPVTLLWPVAVAGAIGVKRWPLAGAYLALSALPVIAWCIFVWAQTGTFGMGESKHDMSHNLQSRVALIAKDLPKTETENKQTRLALLLDKDRLSITEYLAFASEYPGPFLKHAVRDLLVFSGKSGIERLTLDYLPFYAERRANLQDVGTGWRRKLESEGPLATLRHLWANQGEVLLISIAGATLMLTLFLLALIGAVRVVLDWKSMEPMPRLAATIVIALPIYIAVFSQVVNAVQSRHRAPAEAALVILAIYGLLWIGRAVESWRKV